MATGILAKNAPPSDSRAQALIGKAKSLVNEFTGGDAGIEQNLNKMYETEGGANMLRNHGLDISDELFVYYQAVWNVEQ